MFILMPFLLLIVFNFIYEIKSYLIYRLFLLLLFCLIIILFYEIIFRESLPGNSKLTIFMIFYLIPTVLCSGLWSLNFLNKFKAIRGLLTVIVYFLGWIFSVGAGMVTGVLQP